MKTLLCVLTHSAANETFARNFPWYQRAGLPILGVGRVDKEMFWPNDIEHIDIGDEEYIKDDAQLWRFVTLLTLLRAGLGQQPDKPPYDAYAITEYDCIWTRKMPEIPGWSFISLATQIAGHKSGGFRGSRFFHCPWIVQRKDLAYFIDYGERMLNAGLNEHGFIDRWLGLMADLYDIRVHEINGYTRNTLDQPEHIAQAIDAIKDGACVIHGVKTADQLAAVTKGL